MRPKRIIESTAYMNPRGRRGLYLFAYSAIPAVEQLFCGRVAKIAALMLVLLVTLVSQGSSHPVQAAPTILHQPSGMVSGLAIDTHASQPLGADASLSAVTSVVLDFVADYCSATWTNDTGAVLPCPGTVGSADGYVLRKDGPQLENGTTSALPGLITFPRNMTDGAIQGVFPALTVQSGDRFQATVGCEYGATSCFVAFRLDYQIGSGAVQRLWTFYESYDGISYQADIDLSSLAGQSVKFILRVDAYGSPTADSALWVAPRIVRGMDTPSSPTPTLPTATPTAPPTATLSLLSTPGPSGCDRAQFIADITIPDGTLLAPGMAFTKTWRLKNVGTCTWTTSYALVFVSGDAMGAPAVVNLPTSVAPGATVDLSVNMTAPSLAGHYIGYWKLRNAAGVLFGIGATASQSFWVEINVSTTASVIYDFVASYCSATWTNDAGMVLPCPGTEGSTDGYVLRKDAPRLENGVTSSVPGLMTFPRNVTDGFIQGVFPALTVQSGDRFQATVGCEYGATSCYVVFRLDYQIGSGAVQNLWTFYERYEGLYYQANVDLSSLAGQNVKFILRVGAYGSPAGDRALWVAPRIVRGSGAPITPAPTLPPGPLPTPGPTGCDRAQFIADVTIPDGTVIAPGATFTKTWRLKNVGSCTWTTAYKVVFASGDALGATTASPLPVNVPPGSTIDISLPMTAPTSDGHYRGYWLLKNAAGGTFGVGLSGTVPFWVDILVSGSTYTAVYDFYASACDAVWKNGAGTLLPCPGTDGDANGFILKLPSPQLEDGTTGAPGLLTFPQNVTDGLIQGKYPAFTVQAGDRFQAIVNCAYGASGCYVTMRLDYQIGSGPVQTLWSFRERLEGMYYRVDRSLDALAGQNVQFILTVLATGSPIGDRALWVAPRIVRPSP